MRSVAVPANATAQVPPKQQQSPAPPKHLPTTPSHRSTAQPHPPSPPPSRPSPTLQPPPSLLLPCIVPPCVTLHLIAIPAVATRRLLRKLLQVCRRSRDLCKTALKMLSVQRPSDDCVYTFKRYAFTPLDVKSLPTSLRDNKHRIICSDSYLFAFVLADCPPMGRRLSLDSQVMWMYSFDLKLWRKISCKNIPQDFLAYCVISVTDNTMTAYGTTINSTIFSLKAMSNRIYRGNLPESISESEVRFEGMEVNPCKTFADLFWKGALINENNLYLINGNPHEYDYDVHQLDLTTNKWESLYKTSEPNKCNTIGDVGTIIMYNERLYRFCDDEEDTGDGLLSNVCVFDTISGNWDKLSTSQSPTMQEKDVSQFFRKCYSCVQCPGQLNIVFVCGGHSIGIPTDYICKLDLDTLEWDLIEGFTLPSSTTYHSISVTPSGRMCCFSISDSSGPNAEPTQLISAWITVPKLQVIAWEALMFYFQKNMITRSDVLEANLSLPLEYLGRFFDACNKLS